MKVLVTLFLLCGGAVAQTVSEDFATYNRLMMEWEGRGFASIHMFERLKTDSALAAERADLAKRIAEVRARLDAERMRRNLNAK